MPIELKRQHKEYDQQLENNSVVRCTRISIKICQERESEVMRERKRIIKNGKDII